MGKYKGTLQRREFVALLGCAIACSWAARAEQGAPPVIGFFSTASAETYTIRLDAFRRGLQETGLIEGKNVSIEYLWTDGRYDQAVQLAAELVKRQVAVIVAGGGTPTALAAKSVTSTIPIVFAVSVNPVEAGLVGSLNHPGGNLTGVTNLNVEIGPKRLEILRAILPSATNIAVLLNPTNPDLTKAFVRELEPAARATGFRLHKVEAGTDRELDEAFAAFSKQHIDALVMSPDTFFTTRAERIAAMALRDSIPTIYQYRKFARAGGLISYGSDETEYYRLVGIYAGRILKGDKPGDLPVQQSTKVELIINLKTARTLGIDVPLSLSGRADELIE
jgi:putative tryptophan/tyrosine transport system substrate-binding protein